VPPLHTMKFYIASRFKTVGAVNELADDLDSMGHDVVSTWHRTEALAPLALDDPGRPAHLRSAAIRDIAEIDQSDALVILTEGCEQTPGGLWVEVGYALGRRKRVFVVGPQINVFCYLPAVAVDPNTQAFLARLSYTE
jgi:nucleoside 2-deoxyribosyltransferase